MKTDPSSYEYDTPAMNKMLSGGKKKTKGLGRAVRGWIRQGRITGVHQHDKNAKYWYNAYGILEAWKLWAKHTGLDYDADMPPDVKELQDVIESIQDGGRVSAAPVKVPAKNGTVTVIVPFGTEVKIVHEPPAA